MRTLIQSAIDQSIQAVEQLRLPASLLFLEGVARQLAKGFSEGKKVLIAGAFNCRAVFRDVLVELRENLRG